VDAEARYKLAQLTNPELQQLLSDRAGDNRQIVNGRDQDDDHLLSRTEAIDLIMQGVIQ